MWLLALLALALWLLLLIGDLRAYGTPSDQDVAAARAQVDARVAAVDAERAVCLADPARSPDLRPEDSCGVALDPATQDLQPFLDDEPFVVARDLPEAPFWGALVTVPVALAAGLSWLGRRTATRGPSTEVVALVTATAAFAVLGQLLALGRVGLLAGLAGPHPDVVDTGWSTAGLAGTVAGAAARAGWLTLAAALCGLGLAWVARGRAAVIAAALAGWLVVETGLPLLLPAAAPWLALMNADSLLSLTEARLIDPDGPVGPGDTDYAYVAGHLHATLYLGCLAVALLALGLRANARTVPTDA